MKIIAMVESKVQHRAEVCDNGVHQAGKLCIEIKNQDLSWFQRLLGRAPFIQVPAEVDEAGEWREGDKLKLIVENKEVPR